MDIGLCIGNFVVAEFVVASIKVLTRHPCHMSVRYTTGIDSNSYHNSLPNAEHPCKSRATGLPTLLLNWHLHSGKRQLHCSPPFLTEPFNPDMEDSAMQNAMCLTFTADLF